MLTEKLHAGAFIVQEMPGYYSRDALTVALNQSIDVGHVCGLAGIGDAMTATVTPDAGNTSGAGVLTLDATAPVSSAAKNGRYRVICTAEATNAGTFEVTDPNNAVIGTVDVGATFDNQIKFVITDAADFKVGDAFSVDVVRESGTDEEVKALDLLATDGSQVAKVIAVYPAVTDGTTKKQVTFITRNAEVRASDLSWPEAITGEQKAAAIEQLRASGIILR